MPCPTYRDKKRGFTLIELLISISIVAILSGVALMIINPSAIRAKTRDSRRASSLSSVQAALELFYAQNSRYPCNGPLGACSGSPGWLAFTESDPVSTALENGFIRKVDLDPLQDASPLSDPCTPGTPNIDRRYNYKSDGSYYLLTTFMEVGTTVGSNSCANLSQWGMSGCSGSPNVYCYGVENASK